MRSPSLLLVMAALEGRSGTPMDAGAGMDASVATDVDAGRDADVGSGIDAGSSSFGAVGRHEAERGVRSGGAVIAGTPPVTCSEPVCTLP